MLRRLAQHLARWLPGAALGPLEFRGGETAQRHAKSKVSFSGKNLAQAPEWEQKRGASARVGAKAQRKRQSGPGPQLTTIRYSLAS